MDSGPDHTDVTAKKTNGPAKSMKKIQKSLGRHFFTFIHYADRIYQKA